MTRSRLTTFLAGAAVVPVAAVAVAGCGGGGGNSATAANAPPKAAGGRAATVGVAKTRLGSSLVDSQGRTLYLFKKDTGTRSTCFGACATAWPPARTSGRPTAGTGVSAAKLGTTARSDGQRQVTYNGHPLYRFGGDQKAGDTNGQGVNAFGAVWWAVSPKGNPITSAASSGGGTSTGGANGY